MQWAIERSDYRNVHFRGEDGEIRWTPEQFLGEEPPKPKEKKMHPAIQQALLDHAMNKQPDWVSKLKNARKQ